MAKIRVHPHDPQWAHLYGAERSRMVAALGAHLVRIHHVGSTAIPDMPAKPIIDICIESASYPPDGRVIRLLSGLGYQDMGEFGVPGRIWFKKTAPFAFNLHWCPVGGAVVASQLRFKRILSNNAVLAAEYAALKTRLSGIYEEGSLEYNRMKAPFIGRVMESDAEDAAPSS